MDLDGNTIATITPSCALLAETLFDDVFPVDSLAVHVQVICSAPPKGQESPLGTRLPSALLLDYYFCTPLKSSSKEAPSEGNVCSEISSNRAITSE